MVKVHCTECRGVIDLSSDTRKGQIICCNKCGARMAVINLSPFELYWVFDEGFEDWSRYDYNYEHLDYWT